MAPQFRKADEKDINQIWQIIQAAILRRKADGSQQWQDGYPNENVIRQDIANKHGYVLCLENTIVGYCAIIINQEPAYAEIDGKWLSDGDFIVYHRVAIAGNYLGKGWAQRIMLEIEEFAKANQINSVRADTNFDNQGMLKIFEKLGYTYCGEVTFRGASRKAFEKIV